MSAEVTKKIPYQRQGIRMGRNSSCYCGSQKKYKTCCLKSVHFFENLLNQRNLESQQEGEKT